MERIRYSKQNYNQLKKKQYGEYIRRQSIFNIYLKRYYENNIKKQIVYYLNMKRYYEEYIKRQSMVNVYTKKYYEEYIKKQNDNYINMKKYYEEYIRKQNSYYIYIKRYYEEHNEVNNNISEDKIKNDKSNVSQSGLFTPFKTTNIKDNYFEMTNTEEDNVNGNNFRTNNLYDNNVSNNCFEKTNIEDININDNYLKTNNIEDNNVFNDFFEVTNIENSNINEHKLKGNPYDSLEINVEENNLEYKKSNLHEDDYFENKDLNIKSFLEESDKKLLGKNNEKFLGENRKGFLEEYYNIFIKEELFNEVGKNVAEDIYIKLPVVLSEVNVTISIEDTIKLEQEVMEIKRVQKNLYLTQSHLVPFSQSIDEPNSGILFISGFIRKSIEYVTESYNEAGGGNVCDDIRHCTVEVPFKFSTRIIFLVPPIFAKDTPENEFGFSNNKLQGYYEYEDYIIRSDSCEKGYVFSEVFNEKPFVEPVKATFTEIGIIKNTNLNNENSINQTFTEISEKTIVSVILQVLQEQQLKIKGYSCYNE